MDPNLELFMSHNKIPRDTSKDEPAEEPELSTRMQKYLDFCEHIALGDQLMADKEDLENVRYSAEGGYDLSAAKAEALFQRLEEKLDGQERKRDEKDALLKQEQDKYNTDMKWIAIIGAFSAIIAAVTGSLALLQ